MSTRVRGSYARDGVALVAVVRLERRVGEAWEPIEDGPVVVVSAPSERDVQGLSAAMTNAVALWTGLPAMPDDPTPTDADLHEPGDAAS